MNRCWKLLLVTLASVSLCAQAESESRSAQRPAVSEKPYSMMQKLSVLAGTWTARTEQTEDGGATWTDLGSKRVRVELQHKGMLLVEQPDEVSSGGFDMHTAIAFDQYRNLYRQSSTDDVWGVMDLYEGNIETGQLVVTNLKAGTFFPIDEGVWRGFRLSTELKQPHRQMLVEKTDDNGASWQPAFRVEYTKLDRTAGPVTATDDIATSSHEQAEIQRVIELEKSVAVVLGEQGFDAFSALFHPAYENWANGDKVLKRQAYLDGVRPWHEAGNKAISTAMDHVSTELFGDLASSRYRLREDFNNGQTFVGYFTTLAKKHQRRWTLFRTSFTTLYRGDLDQLPAEYQQLK